MRRILSFAAPMAVPMLLLGGPLQAAPAKECAPPADTVAKLVALAGEVAGQSRDWEKNPAVVVVDEVPRDLFVLGDVHGGYHHLQDLLFAAGLIAARRQAPDRIRWRGGPATLVITGDLLDKGAKSLTVVRAVMALQASAAKAGGRVIVLMGNHEVEFFSELKGYEKKEDDQTFHEWLVEKAKEDHLDYLGQIHAGTDRLGVGGVSIGRWLQDLPLAAKVADWFFCHAGNTEGLTVTELEERIRSGVSLAGFRTPFLSRSDSIVEARLGNHEDRDDDGKRLSWWDKGGRERPESLVRRFLTALGVNHLVQGHQPGRFELPDGRQRKPCEPYSHFRGATGKPDAVFFVDTCNAGAVEDSEDEKKDASPGGLILHFKLEGPPTLTTGTLVGYDQKGHHLDLSHRTGWETGEKP